MKMHMSLPATDLVATQAFYRALFGENPAKSKDDYLKFDPSTIALNISFQPASAPLPPAPHLGLEMSSTADLNAVIDRVTAAGYSASPLDNSVCCYARQSKVRVKDPDGHEWELYCKDQDVDYFADADTTCCENDAAADCCQ